MSAEPEPTREEWCHLYDVAVQFRNLAPWEWMQEHPLSGVQNPESGEIGYCSVIGALGEHQEKPGLLPFARPDGLYLARVFDESRQVPGWKDTFRKPEPVRQAPLRPAPVDEQRIAQLSDRLEAGSFEMEFDFAFAPTSFSGEDGGPPYLPFLIIAAEPRSGFLIETDIAEPSSLAERVAESLMKAPDQAGARPRAILTCREEAAALIAPLAGALTISVQRVRSLPAIEAVRSMLRPYLDG